MSRSRLLQHVVSLEIVAFLGMFAIILADELFDLPHWVIGAPVTQANWAELVTETLFLGLLAGVVLLFSIRSLQRIRHLEGFLRICSLCKRVSVDDQWVPVERFVSDHSEAVFSHSLCPECIHEHYGDMFDDLTPTTRRLSQTAAASSS